jgi:hypothetical protein
MVKAVPRLRTGSRSNARQRSAASGSGACDGVLLLMLVSHVVW